MKIIPQGTRVYLLLDEHKSQVGAIYLNYSVHSGGAQDNAALYWY